MMKGRYDSGVEDRRAVEREQHYPLIPTFSLRERIQVRVKEQYLAVVRGYSTDL